MSRYSGVCDIFDEMCFATKPEHRIGGQYSWEVTNEMDAFEDFKESIGGYLYQHKKVIVDTFNQDFVKDHCSNFEIIENEKEVEDKRVKEGVKKVKYFTYKYWGKEYTLKELNKHGVYIEVAIEINNLLDLIPYYPYAVAVACHSGDKSHIIISNKSELEKMDELALKMGRESSSSYYKHLLQKHYIEVINTWFNLEEREVTEELEIKQLEDKLVVYTTNKLDYNFPDIEVKRSLHHWIFCSPSIIDYDKGIVDVTNVWPDELKVGDKITLTYYKKKDVKLDKKYKIRGYNDVD